MYRVLTSRAYAHLDPRPEIRRLPTGNTNVLVRHEPDGSNKIGWERFKKRLAEDGLRKPKRTKLMEERHQARLERERAEAKANGSETKPAEASA